MASVQMDFWTSLAAWRQDDALEIDIVNHTPTQLDFNVTRCRYSEMYKALGMEEYGAVLSCNRDLAVIDGFDNRVELSVRRPLWAAPAVVPSAMILARLSKTS